MGASKAFRHGRSGTLRSNNYAKNEKCSFAVLGSLIKERCLLGTCAHVLRRVTPYAPCSGRFQLFRCDVQPVCGRSSAAVAIATLVEGLLQSCCCLPMLG